MSDSGSSENQVSVTAKKVKFVVNHKVIDFNMFISNRSGNDRTESHSLFIGRLSWF